MRAEHFLIYAHPSKLVSHRLFWTVRGICFTQVATTCSVARRN